VPQDAFLQQLQWLKDECDRIGRDPSELRIVHYSVMLPGESESGAWETYTDHVWQMMWKYSDMEASANRTGPPPPAPELTDDKRSRLFGRSTVAGSSEQIVSNLGALRERAGMPVEFAARSYFPTLELAAQVELMQQLAEEVAPHL
jgi:alkanesulfonate monooxygenase SsuD/methylene tetrahydromethanopterin reductase-like flavin-dependent oxidoreductase (luciferase family)